MKPIWLSIQNFAGDTIGHTKYLLAIYFIPLSSVILLYSSTQTAVGTMVATVTLIAYYGHLTLNGQIVEYLKLNVDMSD